MVYFVEDTMQSMLPSRNGQPLFKYWQTLNIPEKLYFAGMVSIVLHASFLLIPSRVFELLGVHAQSLVVEGMPHYVQFAALHSTTLFLYWLSYPYIAGVNALMFLVAFNSPRGIEFFASVYLRKGGGLSTISAKLKLWMLMLAFWGGAFLVVFVWPQTPNRHGFHPVDNPLMLAVIYGSLFSLLLPPSIAVMLTDIRSWFCKPACPE